MITIQARNVNWALHLGAKFLRQHGVRRDSRNGPVLQAPGPVTTTYTHPMERVLLDPRRDANPFFHLYEAIWMLAGRRDIEPLTRIVKNMENFSDDGETQHGAYGYRWRHWFDRDQLAWAVKRLRENPEDRRVVIQMYDARQDQSYADAGGLDVPCNLMALPAVTPDGRLDLTVFNRSNDMIWGAYGANAVHFSVLQEYLAGMIGVPVGQYHQVSNNFHAYEATLDKAPEDWAWGTENDAASGGVGIERLLPDPYTTEEVAPTPMFPRQFEGAIEVDYDPRQFDRDLDLFMDDPARVGVENHFLKQVACPMICAHRAYRRGDLDHAWEIVGQVKATDWRMAADSWLKTREEKKQ